jgi:23S rRNA (uracil1939-C5)-methyltransferase
VKPIIGMKDPTHYRNKVHAAFGYDRQRRCVVSGIYKPSTHIIVPVSDCMIEDRISDAIITDIRKMLPSFKLQAYDEQTERGFLRHVLVRRGFTSGEVMVVLVASSPIFPTQKPFLKKLLELHPEIKTVVLNINNAFTSMVLGDREKVLYGKGYIEDMLCGKTFRISSRSFYQVNPVQTEILYDTAVKLAGISKQDAVLDAYCGIGTIGLIASDSAGKVVGVETNKDAVRDAIANAKNNNVTNCWFLNADAGDYMSQMADEGIRFDVVFMDPPRTGSDERFIRSLLKMNPARVVYVSCNPETLKRDLKLLVSGGYKATAIQPVDMFPYTEHVETVCLLSKLSEVKNHISVKVDMNEMDLTAAESKATYQEIEEWVKEKYGFHVSHLNIAKTKRKCGIIERQNYNLPKSEDSRSPETPKEKEEAIIAAFKAFRMI